MSINPVGRNVFIGLLLFVVLAVVGTFGLIFSQTASISGMPQRTNLVTGVSPSYDMMDEASKGIAVGSAPIPSKIAPSPLPPVTPPGAGTVDRLNVASKIIKNGALSVQVAHLEEALGSLGTIAKNNNGFIGSSSVVDHGSFRTGSVLLRIPSTSFDTVMNQIRAAALTVFEESSDATDVTDQYIDLTARLKAAQAEEAQYLEILKQAKTVEETLNVTARLGDVRARIEQLQGQLRYLNDRTDYSTINISLTEETNIQIPTRTWQPLETIRAYFQLLIQALQALVELALGALIFLVGFIFPIVLGLGLFIWLIKIIWRAWKRWFMKK